MNKEGRSLSLVHKWTVLLSDYRTKVDSCCTTAPFRVFLKDNNEGKSSQWVAHLVFHWVKREVAQSKDPHRFMNNAEWLGQLVQGLEKQYWRKRYQRKRYMNRPMRVTTKYEDIFIAINIHQRPYCKRGT